LEDVWFARKKKKNVLNVAADETNAHYRRILVPLFAQTQMTYLTFLFLTSETLTKLKTTFGRNLLYWML
jgi:hypothetical protein